MGSSVVQRLSRLPLMQETEVRVLASEIYFQIFGYILLLHVYLFCSYRLTDHYSDPCENMADSLSVNIRFLAV